jgi:hypothetical protein
MADPRPQFHNIAKALAESWQNASPGPNFRIPHWLESVSGPSCDCLSGQALAEFFRSGRARCSGTANRKNIGVDIM